MLQALPRPRRTCRHAAALAQPTAAPYHGPVTGRWRPDSWQEREAGHQPAYRDAPAASRAPSEIAARPPLVFPGEVDKLRNHVALAAEGRSFVLQGGDCVERFLDCRAETIANKLKILLPMSVILTHAARRPVVRVGRMAGQFAKPRTSDTEVVDGREIPSYKGDLINDYAARPADREPDPGRLLEGYHHAVATLNYIRAMIAGGFADLHHPYTWNLHAIEQTEQWPDHREIVEHILDAIVFMESFGGAELEQLGAVEFFTSHEGLHLGYEQALTRVDEASGRHYNPDDHIFWIGNRTRGVDGAHVEYFRGIANPVGVKIGPDIEPGEVRRLLDVLDRRAEPGRITLITRLGADRVEKLLPPLIDEARATGCPVAWSCDPMHGNTRAATGGRKTRQFDDVLREVRETFRVHAAHESRLAGIHFELTAEPVTECTGGAVGLREGDLAANYQSWCDPGLNYAQSMEMAWSRACCAAVRSKRGLERANDRHSRRLLLSFVHVFVHPEAYDAFDRLNRRRFIKRELKRSLAAFILR